MRKQLCVAITLAALGATVQSRAETIDFFFSNPNAGDTVSGVIKGLTQGASSSAASVYITGYTQSLLTYYTFPTPLGITAIVDNTFATDATGTLTAANFNGSGFFGANGSFVSLSINVGPGDRTGGVFQDIIPDQGSVIQTGGDFGNAIFTPATASSVPESATWALMISGYFALGAILRRGFRGIGGAHT